MIQAFKLHVQQNILQVAAILWTLLQTSTEQDF